MKKIFNILFYVFFVKILIHGQNTVIKKTYYDINHTKLKAEWQQTANGYTNGFYKEYYPSGKIYIDRIVKTENVYPYWGYDVKCKIYDEAGGTLWSTQSIARNVYDGEQLSYHKVGSKLQLRSKAIFNKGKLISFKLFNHNGINTLDLNCASHFKLYNSKGEIVADAKISSNGNFTGVFFQNDNNTVVEVVDGKINHVYEKVPDPKNGDWQVKRLTNDTLLSSRNLGSTYLKKYYFDTVKVKLINNPTINSDFTQLENLEFGLDFVDSKFLCCMLSQRYNYDLLFYNRDLQTFIREEIRDVKTDRLISMSTKEKDVFFHENGKVKRIFFSEDNWQDFDEQGGLINSSELEKEKSAQFERDRLKKIENDKRIIEFDKQLFSIYTEFQGVFIETRESLMSTDSYGKPLYKIFYPLGEEFYLKADKLYNYYKTKYESEKDFDQKIILVNNLFSLHYKVMNLSKTEKASIKELNKLLRKVESVEDIEKILGI